MVSEPQIYFHVGLGKTASSYLQQQVFPRLEGIHYIPTRDYKSSKKIIPGLRKDRILVSREFDRQFDREVRWFTETYPQAGTIIVLRRHDSWIASQYRRHVKNGWYYGFESFLDLEQDLGLWKKSDLLYYPKIMLLEQCCLRRPLVLFYDELIENPWSFIAKIADYTHSGFSQSKISLRRVHTSYSEKQLILLRNFCRKFIRRVPEGHPDKLRHWLQYRPFWLLFHLVMYAAHFVPDKFVRRDPLIDPASLQKIKNYYAEDWHQVVEYARRNNPQ